MNALLARNAYPLSFAAAAFLVAVGLPSGDPDTYWHLASGRWMVEHQALLDRDVFSSTISGQPYSVGEWLGQVVLYLAYAAGGWTGIAVLRASLVAVAAFFLARVSLRAGAPVWAALVVASWALVLSKVTWTDRPQLFTLALFPLLLDLLMGARSSMRQRRLALVFPLMLVWTDLHGGYVAGLALVAIFALEAVVQRRARWGLAVVVGGAYLATLLDPASLGFGAAASHAASPPRFIVEESPPDVLTPAGALFAVFVLAALAAALIRGGSLLSFLLKGAFLVLALSAQRHMPLFAVVATPFLAAALADGWRALGRVGPRPIPARAALLFTAFVWIGALASIPFAPGAPDERAYPTGALPLLLASRGALLNEYDWGGWLIWRAPERPVFIDGRLFPYLPGVLDDYVSAVGLGPGWRDALDRRAVRDVLLAPGRPLATVLREDGWPVVASGDGWILLRRP